MDRAAAPATLQQKIGDRVVIEIETTLHLIKPDDESEWVIESIELDDGYHVDYRCTHKPELKWPTDYITLDTIRQMASRNFESRRETVTAELRADRIAAGERVECG